MSFRIGFAGVLKAFALAAALSFNSFNSYGQVVINEVMAENTTVLNADGTTTDWVELYNTSPQAVSIGGFSLTDNPTIPRKWEFPKNLTLPGNAYLVVVLDSSPHLSLSANFSIKGTGDQLVLYSSTTNQVDIVRFGPQVANLTIGRIPNGTGAFALTTPTPGSANNAQQLGSQNNLRINEWMASPSSGKDWFEVYNSSADPVQL